MRQRERNRQTGRTSRQDHVDAESLHNSTEVFFFFRRRPFTWTFCSCSWQQQSNAEQGKGEAVQCRTLAQRSKNTNDPEPGDLFIRADTPPSLQPFHQRGTSVGEG
jgi:hypothetical protein